MNREKCLNLLLFVEGIIMVLLFTIMIICCAISSNKKEEVVQIKADIVSKAITSIPNYKENIEIVSSNCQKEYLEKMSELDNISNDELKNWYVEYKQMINKNSYTYPDTIYDFYDEEELDMLFRVVQAEIGDEYTFIQKCNVASVIFNRLSHESFENEMFKVLTESQFQSISNGRYKDIVVSYDTKLACEFAFSIKDTTNGCLFFDSNGTLNYELEFNDGAHNFYKLTEDKNGKNKSKSRHY